MPSCFAVVFVVCPVCPDALGAVGAGASQPRLRLRGPFGAASLRGRLSGRVSLSGTPPSHNPKPQPFP